MRKIASFFALLLVVNFVFTNVGCVPPTEEKLTEINVDFKDKTQQKLMDFQDKQVADSLFTYFRHKDPTYRYLSAMAFASIQDSLAVDSLANLLTDEISQVRVAAAYAIGQIGSERGEKYLLDAFEKEDTAGVYQYANAAILEAIGKCGSKTYLQALSTISTYQPTDTMLLLGQTYGIYRYGLRKMTNKEGTKKMVDYIGVNYPEEVRFVAANYLARAPKLRLKEYDVAIVDAITESNDPRTRMALALALGKTKSDTALTTIIQQFQSEKDYRVKCNMLRAMGNFDYAEVQPFAFAALGDDNHHVANSAADFFINNGIAKDANTYRRKAKDSLHWETQIKLETAALRHLPRYAQDGIGSANYSLRKRFEQSQNPQEKAAAVRAMGEYGWNYRYIKEAAFPSDIPAVRTASMQALGQIATMDDFQKFFGRSYYRILKEITAYMEEAMTIGEPGMVAEAAMTLRTDKIDFSAPIDSLDFMENALQKIKLPEDIETYNELAKTLAFFKKEPFVAKKPDYNHPIEWVLFNNLEAKNQVVIRTVKGDVELELLSNIAPATVNTFVQLVKQGFYNGQVFHRVVPNFVVQTGSPRNDAYGGSDFTIRSEVPYLHYNSEGYVGMASAGKDTEGTQFFITHSPTLHLDGKYTIFARVTDGMKVVHEIERGDVMQEVFLKK